MSRPALNPGLIVLHSNRLEPLKDVCLQWLAAHPLGPMENETFLVQSNGIAQWIQMAMATRDGSGHGIAFGVDTLLPARFQWQAYRSVLQATTTEPALPERSPYDQDALQWRLLGLLPGLIEDATFAPLAHFLAGDSDGRKAWQLATRLADLFDQYQVYRSDWLAAWADSEDHLVDARGQTVGLPAEQRWQPALWRALRRDMPTVWRNCDRGRIHQRFLRAAADLDPDHLPAGLPRRLVVFGMASLPQQMLDALAALARTAVQVLVCMVNPSRHYWGDLIEQRELLGQYRRQRRKQGRPEQLDATNLHLHAQPLLAAWGKQGRDALHMLDAHDDSGHYADLFPEGRIDLFEHPDTATLLGQLQDDILELRSVEESRQHWPAVDATEDAAVDDSIVFHVAHSPQREVEILHDQLLAAFAADPALQPRDVIVMVPDLIRYAPAIHAVFGASATEAAGQSPSRHIPYHIADRQRRHQAPLLLALERLLALPSLRLRSSEVLELLEVPALRQRFGITSADLPTLRQWIDEANIRWGLDAAHRGQLGLPSEPLHTWRFGLERMLTGYAVGAGDAAVDDWEDIAPLDAVSGLEAALVGPLYRFIATLAQLRQTLTEARSPGAWARQFQQLMERCFDPSDGEELRLLGQLLAARDQWLEECQRAGLDRDLPLAVAREGWLGRIDAAHLSQRFAGGAVTFATLQPMRAIPFTQVCLLGMNDDDFPRQAPRPDFDLMANPEQFRPGDRSRREDERYLFLEALLSARRRLYVSWTGRSVRDHSEQPPSVLVGQLRDHLAAGWQLAQGPQREGETSGQALLRALTTEHPLQPFAAAYFTAHEDSDDAASNLAHRRLFTHAREWQPPEITGGAAGPEPAASDLDAVLPPWLPVGPITLAHLSRFLRDPVAALFAHRLGIRFPDEEAALADDEPFAIAGGLEAWAERDALLTAAGRQLQQDPQQDPQTILAKLAARRQRTGHWPAGSLGQLIGEDLSEQAGHSLSGYRELLEQWPEAVTTAPAIQLQMTTGVGELGLEDVIDQLRGQGQHRARLILEPSRSRDRRQWRLPVLLRHWPAHLALQCLHPGSPSHVISHDGSVELPGLAATRARDLLAELMRAWLDGMQQVTPAEAELASLVMAARSRGDDPAQDRKVMEHFQALQQRAGAFARSFLALADVLGHPRFETTLDRLYRPLVDLLATAEQPA